MAYLTFNLVGRDDTDFFIADEVRVLKARIPLSREAAFEQSCEQRSWTNSFKFCLAEEVAYQWIASYGKAFLLYEEIVEGTHYELYQHGNVTHWRALGPLSPHGLTSQEKNSEIGGFDNPSGAADEACECISLVSKYGLEQGVMRYEEFQILMGRLYPSDRESILSAVESMPLDVRFEYALSMTKRTKPMPQQYWA